MDGGENAEGLHAKIAEGLHAKIAEGGTRSPQREARKDRGGRYAKSVKVRVVLVLSDLCVNLCGRCVNP
jgi:hypothetical protein